MSCAHQPSLIKLSSKPTPKKLLSKTALLALTEACHSPGEGVEEKGREQGEEGGRVRLQRRLEGCVRGVSKFLGLGHIYNILDHMCINEETIKNPDNGESLLRTLFYMRVITKLETTRACVRMWLRSTAARSSVPYIIERFNSFGDSFFHSIANFLTAYLTPPTRSISHTPPLTPSLTHECLMEELLTQPCFLKVMPDEYIFSNALIELLGERPEEFARECVRYRMMLEDIFTADSYRVLLQLNMAFQTTYIRYTQGVISLQDMMAAAEVRFNSSLRTKDQKELKVVMRAFMPTTNIFCMLVEQVLAVSPLIANKPKVSQEKIHLERVMLEEKQEMLERMYPMNSHFCRGNNRCGYKNKPRRRRRKSQCDYDY